MSEPSSGNVFRDLGFNEDEANRLLRESDDLIRRKYAPALTRDEAARRLTPGVLRVVLKHVNDTANDAFYTATVGLDLPDDEVPLFVANATALLLHDEIMIHLYGPPVATMGTNETKQPSRT